MDQQAQIFFFFFSFLFVFIISSFFPTLENKLKRDKIQIIPEAI